jgi:hypothetical protein
LILFSSFGSFEFLGSFSAVVKENLNIALSFGLLSEVRFHPDDGGRDGL